MVARSGPALRRVFVVHSCATGLLGVVFAVVACSERPPDAAGVSERTATEWFTDRARETGLDIVHFNGMTGSFVVPEVIPPGVALLDYDNDSDLDVFAPWLALHSTLEEQPVADCAIGAALWCSGNCAV